MKEVVLGFPDLKSLLAFKQEIDVRVFEFNDLHLTLICACTEDDIELAKSKFGGFVLKGDSQV